MAGERPQWELRLASGMTLRLVVESGIESRYPAGLAVYALRRDEDKGRKITWLRPAEVAELRAMLEEAEAALDLDDRDARPVQQRTRRPADGGQK